MYRFVLALICILGISAHADEKKLGLGFVIGDPTALSLRHNLTSEKAYDVQLAFPPGHYMLAYGDYLFQFHGILGSGNKFVDGLTPYVGVGALLATGTRHDHDKDGYFQERDDHLALAARIPFGIEWVWDKAPIGIGVELAPGIVVVPATNGFVNAGITLRYYL